MQVANMKDFSALTYQSLFQHILKMLKNLSKLELLTFSHIQ